MDILRRLAWRVRCCEPEWGAGLPPPPSLLWQPDRSHQHHREYFRRRDQSCSGRWWCRQLLMWLTAGKDLEGPWPLICDAEEPSVSISPIYRITEQHVALELGCNDENGATGSAWEGMFGYPDGRRDASATHRWALILRTRIQRRNNHISSITTLDSRVIELISPPFQCHNGQVAFVHA